MKTFLLSTAVTVAAIVPAWAGDGGGDTGAGEFLIQAVSRLISKLVGFF
jgi:hypothetical protein